MKQNFEIDDYYPHDMRRRWDVGNLLPYFSDLFGDYSSLFEERINSYVNCYREKLNTIPLHRLDDSSAAAFKPNWVNNFFPGLDALVLYGIVSSNQPSLFLEIGSGNSTRFANQARLDNNLRTRIVSIDPEPRVECHGICDEIFQCRLEDMTDKSIFQNLNSGDILFFDGSHRALMNSDTTILFLEILPTLPKGVILHLHDIFLPMDYPDVWSSRLYSEQYLTAVLLQWGIEEWEVLFANTYTSYIQRPIESLKDFWDSISIPSDHNRCGSSLWLRKL